MSSNAFQKIVGNNRTQSIDHQARMNIDLMKGSSPDEYTQFRYTMKNSQEAIPQTTTDKLVRVVSKTGVSIRDKENSFLKPSYIDIVRQTSRVGMQDGLQF
jgi:hypothetical protein